jgi:hypothetical protein
MSRTSLLGPQKGLVTCETYKKRREKDRRVSLSPLSCPVPRGVPAG